MKVKMNLEVQLRRRHAVELTSVPALRNEPLLEAISVLGFARGRSCPRVRRKTRLQRGRF
jgi:hypothetical protein